MDILFRIVTGKKPERNRVDVVADFPNSFTLGNISNQELVDPKIIKKVLLYPLVILLPSFDKAIRVCLCEWDLDLGVNIQLRPSLHSIEF